MSDNCAKLGEFGGAFIVAAMEAQRSGDVAREVALLLGALEAVDEPVHHPRNRPQARADPRACWSSLPGSCGN